MHRLTLMRHAKSSWSHENLADHDRPLNGRGQRAAYVMAAYMVQNCLIPDVILCSTATRTRQTLQMCLNVWGPLATCCTQVVLSRKLYMASSKGLLRQAFDWQKAGQHTLIIAHNPGMEDLLGALCQSSKALPTASVASFAPIWLEGSEPILDSAPLTHFMTPKALV